MAKLIELESIRSWEVYGPSKDFGPEWKMDGQEPLYFRSNEEKSVYFHFYDHKYSVKSILRILRHSIDCVTISMTHHQKCKILFRIARAFQTILREKNIRVILWSFIYFNRFYVKYDSSLPSCTRPQNTRKWTPHNTRPFSLSSTGSLNQNRILYIYPL